MAEIPEEEIICKCHQVSEQTIRACIEKHNLTTVDQVTQACEAGGGCHSCHMLLELFIDQHQEKMSAAVASDVQKASDEKQKNAGRLRRFFRRMKPSETVG
jgi:NifU-like protein